MSAPGRDERAYSSFDSPTYTVTVRAGDIATWSNSRSDPATPRQGIADRVCRDRVRRTLSELREWYRPEKEKIRR